jgi:MFS family permease
MLRTFLPVLTLLIGATAFNFGLAIQGTLLPIRGTVDGFSTALIGLLGSANFIGFAAGCLYGPGLVASVGHLRVFAGVAAMASCIALGHALIVDPWFWIVIRLATGFCAATMFMVTESWLSERSTLATRATVFSIYAMLLHLSNTGGQASVSQVDPSTFTLFGIASVVISLASLPMLMTRVEQPEPIARVAFSMRTLWLLSPVGVIGSLGSGLSNGAFGALLPVAADAQGVAPANIALLVASAALAAAVLQWPIGIISDRADRRFAILLCCLGALSAAVLIGMRPPGVATPLLFAGAAMYGAFAFPIYVLCVAHTSDHAPTGSAVTVTSGLLLLWSGGAAVGPMAASALIAALGDNALFLFTGSVHLSVAVYTLWRLRRSPAPRPAEKESFTDAAIQATTVSAVDPVSPGGQEPVVERST